MIVLCDLHIARNVLCTAISHAVVYKHASFAKILKTSHKIHACTSLVSFKFKLSCTVHKSSIFMEKNIIEKKYFIISQLHGIMVFEILWYQKPILWYNYITSILLSTTCIHMYTSYIICTYMRTLLFSHSSNYVLYVYRSLITLLLIDLVLFYTPGVFD